jgi:hypothetical protein
MAPSTILDPGGEGNPSSVTACGESAPVLSAHGKGEAAVRLEHLWDEIAKTYGVDILRAYPLINFHGRKAAKCSD